MLAGGWSAMGGAAAHETNANNCSGGLEGGGGSGDSSWRLAGWRSSHISLLRFHIITCGFLTVLPLCLMIRPKAFKYNPCPPCCDRAPWERKEGREEGTRGEQVARTQTFMSHVIIVLRCDEY